MQNLTAKPCRKCGHVYRGRQCRECKKKSNAKWKRVHKKELVGRYQGKPCSKGHDGTRYKGGGACVICAKEKSRAPDVAARRNAGRRAKYETPEGRIDRRARNLKANYGMTLEQYDEMVASQGNACAICLGEACGSSGRFHVDHDHVTGKVRALLCHTCNVGIGSLKDSPDLLRLAADYIEKHRA